MTTPSTPTPDSAGWIEWKGGDNPPTLARTVIDVRFRDGDQTGDVAGFFRWYHLGDSSDIIAYRLSDRLANERSAREAVKPSDQSAVAGAMERLEAQNAELQGLLVTHEITSERLVARVKALEDGLRSRMIQAYLVGAESMAFGSSGHAAIQQKAERWVDEIVALLGSTEGKFAENANCSGSEGRDDG